MHKTRVLRSGTGPTPRRRGAGRHGHAPAANPASPEDHPYARPRARLRRSWQFATEYLLALPLGAAVAMAWANVWPESYFRTAFGLDFIVTDVAMVFFFALITKEVVEATAPGGVLHTWRRVMLPVMGALGISVVSALLFAGFAIQVDDARLVQGWPSVLAVDLALVYFVARLVFGRHPVVPFVLLLAIAANGFAFLALAVGQPPADLRPGALLALMGAALAVLVLLRRQRVKSFWPYVLAGGSLSWAALFFGGFHPALALVPVIPFLPHAPRDRGFFVDARPDDRDALSRLELWCRHPAQAALFLFGLVSAGVPLAALEAGTWSLPVAALAGRPIGLLLAVAIGLAAGLHLPDRVTVRHLVVVAFITTIGFTMALFFAKAAVGPGPVLSALKMGALLTLGGIVLAFGSARLLHVGRFADEHPMTHTPAAPRHRNDRPHTYPAHGHARYSSLLRIVFSTGVLLAGLWWVAPAGGQAPSEDERLALQDFDRRLMGYVELHRRLEGPLPTLEVSTDLREVQAAIDALARDIRKARPGARQGDIFTPAISRVLRTRIAACLPPEQMADVLAEDDAESPRVLPRLRVNADWPPEMPFNFVPPQMLAVLPMLPPELQYRIVGRSVVLWDHHANLIVDYLPRAFTT